MLAKSRSDVIIIINETCVKAFEEHVDDGQKSVFTQHVQIVVKLTHLTWHSTA